MADKTIDSIIDRAKLRKLIGISKSTEWRMRQAGALPKAVVVNNRILGYLESSYAKWLEDNLE